MATSDAPPTPAELADLEDRVDERFTRWLKRHGYLDEDGVDSETFDGWWTAADSDPSAPSFPRRPPSG